MLGKGYKNLVPAAVFAACVAMGAGQAQAADFTLNVSGIQSFEELGSAANTLRFANLGANAHVTGFAWNVNVTAFSPSWLSELSLALTDSTGSGVLFSPSGTDASGTASYSGSANLVNLGLDFNVGADGQLVFEFYEEFDDSGVNPDGRWNSGTLTVTYETAAAVPEPETYALMLAGLGVVGWAAKRRKVV